MAATEPGIAVAPSALDVDPHLLNAANGTVDLHTGHLRPHDPADLITKVCAAAYHPSAVAPKFREFLRKIQPDPEMRDFLGRLFGHALPGVVTEHVLVVLYGIGANGKSTLTETVSKALGDYAAPVDPAILLERFGDAHPTGLASLFGLRLAITSETRPRPQARRSHRQETHRRRRDRNPTHARGLLDLPAITHPGHAHQPQAADPR
jgi:putative DNA primase/helicase